MAKWSHSIPEPRSNLAWVALRCLAVFAMVYLSIGVPKPFLCAADQRETSGEAVPRSVTLSSQRLNSGDVSGGNVSTVTNVFGVPVRVADESRWRAFFTQAVSVVAESTNRYYRRGKEVPGADIARRMRSKLAVVQELYSDPYGGEVSCVLDILTSADGLTREGAFGKREPYMVDIGGARLPVYEWVKARLGVRRLPGELTLEEEKQLLTGNIGTSFPPLEFGANRLKALTKFQELISGVERLIESVGCKFYDGNGEVNKDQVLSALRSWVSSEEFRRRYLWPIDAAGFGLGGERAVAAELKRILTEAFGLSGATKPGGVSPSEWHRLRERAAYGVLSNGMAEFSNVWRDVFSGVSKSETEHFYMVECDGSRTNVVAWALDKLGVKAPEIEPLEIPWQVERVFKLLGD